MVAWNRSMVMCVPLLLAVGLAGVTSDASAQARADDLFYGVWLGSGTRYEATVERDNAGRDTLKRDESSASAASFKIKITAVRVPQDAGRLRFDVYTEVGATLPSAPQLSFGYVPVSNGTMSLVQHTEGGAVWIREWRLTVFQAKPDSMSVEVENLVNRSHPLAAQQKPYVMRYQLKKTSGGEVRTPGSPGTAGGMVPALVAPLAEAVLDNGRRDGKDKLVWDFRWEAVPGAQEYELVVARRGSSIPMIQTRVRDTSYHHEVQAFVAEANRSGWTWKVRAIVGGQPQLWSRERLFDVEPEDSDPPK